jgi:methylmalonyl-CoA mutase, C-terminal domain
MSTPARALVAGSGVDDDAVAAAVARALRDAGMEVVYAGPRHTPEKIVAAALAEDVDAVGLSGAGRASFARVLDLLGEAGAYDVVVFGAGVAAADRRVLVEAGVLGVFPPDTPASEIVAWLTAALSQEV